MRLTQTTALLLGVCVGGGDAATTKALTMLEPLLATAARMTEEVVYIRIGIATVPN